jgi:methylthioribose-1-phosphate isomerase
MQQKHDSIRAIKWQDDALYLLDQRILPQEETYIKYDSAIDVAQAIQDMVVRGAPAIGITAAFGVVLAVKQRISESAEHWPELIKKDMQILAESRPTAVNLFWALDKMQQCITNILNDRQNNVVETLLEEAKRIHQEDISANYAMGQLGAQLIEPDSGVLTHCNAGSLATGGFGTALGVIRQGWNDKRINRIFADETRPWWQGARLTAWELLRDNIPVQLIVDSAAATLMQQKKIQWVIVGSDRIAANGDVANKIGTYSLAVNARYHGVKFMVVAPSSTVDMSCARGLDIPIEARNEDELFYVAGQRIAAKGANAWNPVFDVTPAALVDAIVTEKGVVMNPNLEKMQHIMQISVI